MSWELTAAQREALDRLARCVDATTYLAGGVAVALRMHHRQSRDLDLFSTTFDPVSRTASLAAQTAVRIVGSAEDTLQLDVNGVPASWIRYPYPLLSPPERIPSVPVPIASLDDLMCMKLSAIAGRGAARDFWDLHEILTHRGTTLENALSTFARKYPSHDPGHVLKSLAYFADADAEPLPRGLTVEHWLKIKLEFTGWVAAV